ncbi:response regulator [Pseudodesulfovibrio senegalensis]|uniref:histidine kinase n=1 Tax=Pseudodesulfovibrio senegalensis TaxID=1721087 RepID=A0A6N6N1V6_9BACT|nr:response regulator [Pseudodesulfovibrio senegalensis]KAB1441628.1 response regulator [Pseudodesulfovibrio senegalensis]
MEPRKNTGCRTVVLAVAAMTALALGTALQLESGAAALISWPQAPAVAVFLLVFCVGLSVYSICCFVRRGRRIRRMESLERELKQARDQSEQAGRLKDEFLANVSHELRTPLNGVIGMINLLRMTQLDEDQREYCDLAMESAEQQLSVIDDLIDFSRMETGRLLLVRREFNPVRVARSVVDACKPRAELKGLALNLSIDGDVPSMLVGDDSRVRQVLLNLVDNAIKYTDRGSVDVVLGADCAHSDSQGCRVRFEVRDTGVGISPSRQALVFEKFTQGDGSLTRLQGGSGLGLTIVRSLAELMGGSVTVDSEPGNGSVFVFTAPFFLGRDSYRQEAVVEAMRDRPLFSGYRVLLVEDERVNRVSLARLLEKQGHAVVAASSGREALSVLRQEEVDCVLMDVNMPGMDGLEVTRMIREGDAGNGMKDIPVIAVTALANEDDRRRCMDAGMDGCVFKPADADSVAEEVMRVMTRRVLSAVK